MGEFILAIANMYDLIAMPVKFSEMSHIIMRLVCTQHRAQMDPSEMMALQDPMDQEYEITYYASVFPLLHYPSALRVMLVVQACPGRMATQDQE